LKQFGTNLSHLATHGCSGNLTCTSLRFDKCC